MPEGSSNPEALKPIDFPTFQEKFITGNHSEGVELPKISENQLKGDLSEHAWPKDVIFKTTVLQPDILAVDSLPPIPVSKITPDVKRRIFWMLPGNPQNLNAKDKSVTVVMCDPFFNWINIIDEMAKKSPKYKEIMELTKKSGVNITGVKNETVPASNSPQIALQSLGLLLAAVAYPAYEAKKYAKGEEQTRRGFLKLSAKWLGALSMYGIFAKYIEDSKGRVVFIPQEDATDIDGRTASILIMSEETAEMKGKKKLAIVAGSAHEHNKRELLDHQSKRDDARSKAVRAYAEVRLKILDDVSKVLEFTSDQKYKATNDLLDSLCQMQTLTVKGIDQEQINPEKVLAGKVYDMLDEAIEIDKTNEPILSERMLKILERYRPTKPEAPDPSLQKVYNPWSPTGN